jgi:hypothetical protein
MAPSTARAESCGMSIINEAFANDYTVPSYHTQACYRQANDLLAADTTVGGYLNELGDGIRAAMARDRKADLDRLNGGTTSKPADEDRSTAAAGVSSTTPPTTKTIAPAADPATSEAVEEPSPQRVPIERQSDVEFDVAPGGGLVSDALIRSGPDNAGDVPVPVIVLGGLAALLVSGGIASAIIRRRSGSAPLR